VGEETSQGVNMFPIFLNIGAALVSDHFVHDEELRHWSCVDSTDRCLLSGSQRVYSHFFPGILIQIPSYSRLLVGKK
jgi:hypothetical protein